jgi:hypothetical protein
MRVPEDVAGALDHVQAAASDAFVEDARVLRWDEGVAVAGDDECRGGEPVQPLMAAPGDESVQLPLARG